MKYLFLSCEAASLLVTSWAFPFSFFPSDPRASRRVAFLSLWLETADRGPPAAFFFLFFPRRMIFPSFLLPQREGGHEVRSPFFSLSFTPESTQDCFFPPFFFPRLEGSLRKHFLRRLFFLAAEIPSLPPSPQKKKKKTQKKTPPSFQRRGILLFFPLPFCHCPQTILTPLLLPIYQGDSFSGSNFISRWTQATQNPSFPFPFHFKNSGNPLPPLLRLRISFFSPPVRSLFVEGFSSLVLLRARKLLKFPQVFGLPPPLPPPSF